MGEWKRAALTIKLHGVDFEIKYSYDHVLFTNWEIDNITVNANANLYDALCFGSDIIQACESAVNADFYDRKAGR